MSMSYLKREGYKFCKIHTVEDDVCCGLTAECWNIEAPTWTHVLQTPCLTPPALLETLKQPISSAVPTYCKWLRNMCLALSPTDANSCQCSWIWLCAKAFRVTFSSNAVRRWRFAVTLTATLLDFTWSSGGETGSYGILWILRSLCEQLWMLDRWN